MTTPQTKPRRGPQPRYVNQRSLDILSTSFPGMIPAVVIAKALEEKARREHRPLPPAEGRQA